MSEAELFPIIAWSWLGVGLLSFALLLAMPAPYGRHLRQGWGPTVSRTVGWIAMELPALLVVVALFAWGDRQTNPVALVFVALWSVHYTNRSLVYPLRLRGGQHRMPALIAGFAVLHNLVNGYLQGRYLFLLGPIVPVAWLVDPRFVVGLVLFATGMAINLWADAHLRRLRRERPGRDYVIPRAGLFRWVACPNYLGEIVEWWGWALLTWSLPGLVFAVWTMANLVPRALAHRRWYRGHFPDYPPRRRALLPFII